MGPTGGSGVALNIHLLRQYLDLWCAFRGEHAAAMQASHGAAMFPGSFQYSKRFIEYSKMIKKQGARQRTNFSWQQLTVLERIFEIDPLPRSPLLLELSERLDLTPRCIQVWFQNRRQKHKAQYQAMGKAPPPLKNSSSRLSTLDMLLPNLAAEMAAAEATANGAAVGYAGAGATAGGSRLPHHVRPPQPSASWHNFDATAPLSAAHRRRRPRRRRARWGPRRHRPNWRHRGLARVQPVMMIATSVRPQSCA